MNMYVALIFNLACSILGVLSTVRQFQMLQQNSYFAVRYLRWYKGSFGFGKLFNIAVAVLGAVLIAMGILSRLKTVSLLLCALFLVFLLINALVSLNQNKKSIKKLVVTARVKRMFVCTACLFAVLTALSLPFGQKTATVMTAVIYFLSMLSSLTVLIVLTLMKPVEKAISNYYVNDAKKLLKGMKNLKIIGVTGSYGKTSTKFILGRILSEKYNTLVTPENYNTPMGIVLTVRNLLRPQTEVFVAEMGAKCKGDIAEVCSIADATMGVITSIGPQHLETFKNIETVTSTKFELADHVKQNGGKMFLNTDNEYINANKNGYDYISYGTKNADCKAENISYSPSGLTLTVTKGDLKFDVTSKLLGTHNALNITAAAAVALELGLTPDEIAFAVSKLKPIEHRLQLKSYINGSTLIDDAYNSNPEGSLESVRVLGSFKGMKKIIVTPGLVELGDKEYECNHRLGAEAAKVCDVIILVGKKRWAPLKDGVLSSGNFDEQNLYTVSSFKEAVTVFSTMCDSNTVILFENDLPDNYLN